MGLGLFFFSVASGYYFLRHWTCSKYYLIRSTGYHAFFLSTIAGIVLFIIPFIIVWFCVETPNTSNVASLYDSKAFILAILISCLLGFSCPHIFNIVLSVYIGGEEERDKKYARKAMRKIGDLIGLNITEAMDDDLEEVMIYMKNKEIYIGFIKQYSQLRNNSDIEILPMQGGYIDTDTFDVVINNNYFYVYNYYLFEKKQEDYDPPTIVIPRSEIVSVVTYDKATFDRMIQMKN